MGLKEKYTLGSYGVVCVQIKIFFWITGFTCKVINFDSLNRC